ncbi:MAG: low specificity L-threonine aldolase [Alphaproteobacteria bacterium]|nr:low specificity L-threonine aldolase [Alphaproteobacteria bacterium]
MDFRSDNVAGIAPAILAAIAAANAGSASSYGEDDWTKRLQAMMNALFERDVAVFPVATGTAANALALSALAPPWGLVCCHRLAHIEEDECGAPEFFTGGAKLAPMDGAHGKIGAEDLARFLDLYGFGVQHHVQPAAVSISQASECGTVYSVAETRAIAEVCRRHRLALHMDGARFANALVHQCASPAEATWRAGVDVLSFGATKNGAMAAEAVVFFDPARAADFLYRRKRAGHLFSKMRFLSAQLVAYLEDGLWLRLAANANAMAERLARGLASLPGAELAHPVEANEVFVRLPRPVRERLASAGARFHPWISAGADAIRLVVPFDADEARIDRFLAVAATAQAPTP